AAVFGAWVKYKKTAGGAVSGIDRVVIRNVVAVVLARRFLKGHQPNRGDAEAVEIIQTPHQALEIADAVAVGIHVGADGQAVDNGVLVPEVLDHPTVRLSVRAISLVD